MDIENNILAVLKENPLGLSIEEVAQEVGIHRMTASRYLAILLAE